MKKLIVSIIIILLLAGIAFGVSILWQNNWNFQQAWNSVFGATADVDATQPTDPAETTPPTEEPTESTEPTQPDAELEYIINADKSISMDAYVFVNKATENAYGAWNILHPVQPCDPEVRVDKVHFIDDCETVLGHNHEDEEVELMVAYKYFSVLCCQDEEHGFEITRWDDLNKSVLEQYKKYEESFKDTTFELCEECDGLVNVAGLMGLTISRELTDEEWELLEKIAISWEELDEETNKVVRRFGIMLCSCEEPSDKPSEGGPGTDPTDPVHTHKYTDEVTPPTCEEKGYTTHTCECGHSYKDSEVDALGHDWSEWTVTKQPTETEEGEETRTCKRCQKTETRPIAKLNHEHSYTKVVTAPTCDEKGYTTYTCSCGHSYVADETEALGHDWGDWVVTKQPTETEEGEETRTCKRCGITETRPIAKVNHEHNYTKVVTAPTCDEKGYTTYTCSCGHSYVADETEALGHDWGDWVVTKQPTASEDGEEVRTCQRCGKEQRQSIPALGNPPDDDGDTEHNDPTLPEDGEHNDPTVPHEHSYSKVVVSATCTEGGFTTFTCECGETYTGEYTNALGHNWGDWVVTKQPTETEEGEETRTCSRCNATEKRGISPLEQPPVHEHVYTEVVTAPTCTEGGYTTFICECGESYVGEHTDALGHTWGEWVVTKQPTATEDGQEVRTCGHCGKQEFGTIDALGVPEEPEEQPGPGSDHNDQQPGGDDEMEQPEEQPPVHEHVYTEVVTAPTCTEGGYTTFICECGESYVGEHTDALGHTWGEWVVTKQPTATEDGQEVRTCGHCGKQEFGTIDALGVPEEPEEQPAPGSDHNDQQVGGNDENAAENPAEQPGINDDDHNGQEVGTPEEETGAESQPPVEENDGVDLGEPDDGVDLGNPNDDVEEQPPVDDETGHNDVELPVEDEGSQPEEQPEPPVEDDIVDLGSPE